MKRLFAVLMALLMVLSVCAFCVSAESDSETESTSEAESSAAENMDVEVDFNPAGFTRNLDTMGLGMLGIFVVVGVVILITFGLNSATSKKK